MTRIIVPTGDFLANAVAAEPPSDLVALQLWAYLGASAAASPNLVDGAAMTVTGTPVWSSNYVTVTPDVNHLAPVGVVDTAATTLLFIARTHVTGGSNSPVLSAYPAQSGIYVGLGSDKLRVHASGLNGVTTVTHAGSYGSEFAFWSVTAQSLGTPAITWKDWTHDVSGTMGTNGAARGGLGSQYRVGGYTSAGTGTFAADVMFVAKSAAIMSAGQIEACYRSARLAVAEAGFLV